MRCIFGTMVVLALLGATAAGGMFLLQRQLHDAPTHRAPPGRPTILYPHGNAGEMADRRKRRAFWRQAGFGVAFLFWRSLGGSGGTITEAGLHIDADAACDWLTAQGVAPGRLAVVSEPALRCGWPPTGRWAH